MLKTLDRKLGTLLTEIEAFSETDKRLALCKFIQDQIGLMETTHKWSTFELTCIQARAVDIIRGLHSQEKLEGKQIYQNDDLLRTYCFAQASYEFLRGMGMTAYHIELQREKPKEIACNHEKVEYCETNGAHLCAQCHTWVKPLLWVSIKTEE